MKSSFRATDSSTFSLRIPAHVLTFLLTLCRVFVVCPYYNPFLANICYSLTVSYFHGTLSCNLALFSLRNQTRTGSSSLPQAPSLLRSVAILSPSLPLQWVGVPAPLCPGPSPPAFASVLLQCSPTLALVSSHLLTPASLCAVALPVYKMKISLLSHSSFPLYPVSLYPFLASTTPLRSSSEFCPHPVPSQDHW